MTLLADAAKRMAALKAKAPFTKVDLNKELTTIKGQIRGVNFKVNPKDEMWAITPKAGGKTGKPFDLGAKKKEHELNAALKKVQNLAKRKGATPESIEGQLPKLVVQHGLKRLELIKTQDGLFKIRGEVNPSVTLPLPSLALGDIQVRQKLQALGIKPKDVDKIITSLEISGGGDAIGTHIKSGKFDLMEGYRDQVLLQIKQKDMVPSVLQALDKGKELLALPLVNKVVFERKSTTFPKYDVDVASVDPNGDWSSVYQLKTVPSIESIRRNAFIGKNEIKFAPGNKKWVEIKVLSSGTKNDFLTKIHTDGKPLPDSIKNFWPTVIGLRITFPGNQAWEI
jgi:hypothetical protein